MTFLLPSYLFRPLTAVAAAVGCAFALVEPVAAERLENRIAVFAALDKVTARISELQVPLNESVAFGALKITPRVCYSRPATERPKTTSFVEVLEANLDGSEKQLFSGWMFAESPGLNAVEHPVFDVWLTRCLEPVGGSLVVDQDGEARGEEAAGEDRPVRRTTPRRRFRR